MLLFLFVVFVLGLLLFLWFVFLLACYLVLFVGVSLFVAVVFLDCFVSAVVSLAILAAGGLDE